MDTHPGLRIRQALWHSLHTIVPDLAGEIRNTMMDPYHHESIKTADDVKVWLLKLSKAVDPDPDYPNYEQDEYNHEGSERTKEGL
jgi:hypothetical protein